MRTVLHPRPRPLVPMTDDQLREFVLGYCDRQIFTSADIPAAQQVHLMPVVFLPIALGGLQHISKKDAKRIGIVWEWYREAMPRSINGMPCFGSCRFMLQEDWDRAKPAILAELERRKNITL